MERDERVHVLLSLVAKLQGWLIRRASPGSLATERENLHSTTRRRVTLRSSLYDAAPSVPDVATTKMEWKCLMALGCWEIVWQS